ncbi:hypothetical protein ACLB2K_051802 [Fragaria x ananassa]
MCSLESLELCLLGTRGPITDIGGLGISAIRTLKELILIHPDVSDSTMVALAENCSKLETLDIKGCENVTIAGICAFCNHECLKILTWEDVKIIPSEVNSIVLGSPSLYSVVAGGLIQLLAMN